MCEQHQPTFLNGVPSQLERRLAALGDGFAPVDGRSLAELLAFAPSFGELIYFFDLDDQIDGDWSDFYGADPALSLAATATFDLEAVATSYRAAVARCAGERALEPKLDALCAAAAAIVALARRVDRCLCWLGSFETRWHLPLRELVEAELVEPLRTLAAYDAGAAQRPALGRRLGLDLEGFSPFWGLGALPPDSSIFWGADAAAKVDHALPRLEPIFEAFFGGFAELRRRALALLPASLESGDHRPQSALYLAFAVLFGHAQATVNTFSRRYVDFYYRDVLRECERGAEPDRVYLTFTLADKEGLAQSTVSRGTLFTAGRDAEGQEILYAGERTLTVTRARLELLRTLRVVHTGEPPMVQQVLATEAGVAVPAILGFALASPTLLLTGGMRTINVEVCYRLDAAVAETTLRAALENGFRLWFSTAEGWLEMSVYGVELCAPLPRFKLVVDLPAAAPAIVPLAGDDATTLPNPAPELPTLLAELRQEPVVLADGAEVWPLAILGGMSVERFEIRVSVTGLADLLLSGNEGALDAAATFLPFGGTPVGGSTLRIAQPELFVKRLESLSFELSWFGLPPNEEGFRGYYKDWVIGLDGRRSFCPLFTNASFLGTIRIANPGAWDLAAGSEEVYLFRAGEDCGATPPPPAAPLCPASAFKVGPLECAAVPEWYDPAAGAIELILSAPPYAFGNDLYTQNVLNAVLQDLEKVEGELEGEGGHSRRQPLAYPNEPWLPQAQGLAVSYTASGGGEAFHLLPFGGWQAVESAGEWSLLPQVEPAGQLLLGFSGLETAQTLSLLFELEVTSAQPTSETPRWGYLADGAWRELAPSQVLLDQTRGLQATGIVALALPALQPAGSLTVPADLQWLRAAAAADLGGFPALAGVVPHVLSAVRVLDGAALEEPVLPAGSITGAVEDLPEIGTIDQPLPSFGGRPAENRHRFDLRLGERLRHKDRAQLSWDVERLVLERFPAVWKVGVLPARRPEGLPAPGNVVVMIVPGPDARTGMDPTAPLATADLLAAIAEMLAERASPFVRYHVVNPVYVRVRVEAWIELSAGAAGGEELDRLENELVAWLSPWFYDAERATLGGDYASETAIAEWLASQPAVERVEAVMLIYDPPLDTPGLRWCFLTSAKEHRLHELSF